MPKRPSPMKLWQESNGDEVRYVQLMRQHGHIVERNRDAEGNLVYSAKEMAELVLLTAARFRSYYRADHGHLPEDALVTEKIAEVLKGKVIGE